MYDNKLIWVLVTMHGGKFQTILDKHVTHLVAAEACGVSSLFMCSVLSLCLNIVLKPVT